MKTGVKSAAHQHVDTLCVLFDSSITDWFSAVKDGCHTVVSAVVFYDRCAVILSLFSLSVVVLHLQLCCFSLRLFHVS